MRDTAARIRAFLRQRDAPASSLMLVDRFLRAAVPSEELATRLLRPVLEPEGMSYQPAAGWLPPEAPDPQRPCPVAVVIDPGADRAVAAPAVPLAGARPADDLSGAVAVMADPRRDGARLRQWLRSRGLAAPEAIVSLASVARKSVRVPRGAGLPAICALLGVRWLEGDRIEDAAEAMAACVARALGDAPQEVVESATEEIALPAGITADDLAELPAAPGVYRFYDTDGALLYVGKAKNLRRRVGSYFRRPRAAGHGSRFLHRVHRMEHETVGSDLEALLREARLIGRLGPAGNVQNTVRERGRRYEAARTVALLLRREGGGASVIVVENGRYRGHATLGPRGGGLPAARRLLVRVLGGSPGRRGRATARVDRDTEILNSWLARHAGAVSRLDLDGFTTVEDACSALRAAVDALRSEPGPAVFRSGG